MSKLLNNNVCRQKQVSWSRNTMPVNKKHCFWYSHKTLCQSRNEASCSRNTTPVYKNPCFWRARKKHACRQNQASCSRNTMPVNKKPLFWHAHETPRLSTKSGFVLMKHNACRQNTALKDNPSLETHLNPPDPPNPPKLQSRSQHRESF